MKITRRLLYRKSFHRSCRRPLPSTSGIALLIVLFVLLMLLMLSIALALRIAITRNATLSYIRQIHLEMGYESCNEAFLLKIEKDGVEAPWEGTVYQYGNNEEGVSPTRYRFQSVPPGQTTIPIGMSYNNLYSSAPITIYRQSPENKDEYIALRLSAYSAYVVHNVSYQGHTLRYPTIYSANGSSNNENYPLYASGTIRLNGDVNLSSIYSPAIPRSLKSFVWSDSSQAESIKWTMTDPLKAGHFHAKTTFKVKESVGPKIQSLIDSNPDIKLYLTASERKNPPIRVKKLSEEIDKQRSAPLPNIGGFGSKTTLSGEPKYYYPSDLIIEGDLNLDDTKLYVAGDLTIKGSITGTGSILVKGNTQFEGASAIDALQNGEDQVALLSKGYVTVKGFDGSDFLEKVLDLNPNAPKTYDVALGLDENLEPIRKKVNLHDAYKGAQEAQQELIKQLQNAYRAKAEERKEILKEGGVIDQQRRKLGGLGSREAQGGYLGVLSNAIQDHQPQEGYTPEATYHKKTYKVVKETIDTTRDFSIGNHRHAESDRVIELANQALEQGAISNTSHFDACMEALNNPTFEQDKKLSDRLLSILIKSAGSLDLYSPGRTHFQGLVYSESGIYADHEISITGGLYVDAPEEKEGFSIVTDNPNTMETPLSSGEVRLQDGCHIKGVQSILQSVAVQYDPQLEQRIYLGPSAVKYSRIP